MREILFRGRWTRNGKWEEGFYARLHDGKGNISHRIYSGYAESDCGDFYPEWFEVDPSTVGQYTGLTDKNGERIFEGDIVHILGDPERADWLGVNYNALIAFLDGGFCAIDGTIEEHGFRRYALARMDFTLEVIGNKWDNPELLEVDG